MPKPILPEDLSPTMRAGAGAGRILDAKAEEVAVFTGPALDGDVAGIHDMRVAVKRLREAIRLFRRLLPGKRRRRVLSLVDELNDRLGQVRELDVLLGDAAWVAENAPAADGPLSELREQWGEERQRQHQVLIGVWDRLRKTERIIRSVHRLARATSQRRRPLNDMDLDQFAYAAITARTAQVRRRLVAALGTDDTAALHRLRISVKRLKYTLEPFLTLFPAMGGAYGVSADVQEALGLAHDYDVLDAALTDYLDRVGAADSNAAQEALGVVRARRAEVYVAAREHIEQLDADTWERDLLDSID